MPSIDDDVTSKIKDIISWLDNDELGPAADNLIPGNEDEAVILLEYWDNYQEILIKSLKITVGKSLDISNIYIDFIHIVKSFYSLSCKTGIEIIETQAFEPESRYQADKMIEELRKLDKKEHTNFTDLVTSYKPLVEKIRDLQMKVKAEKEAEDIKRKKNIRKNIRNAIIGLFGAIFLLIIGAIIG